MRPIMASTRRAAPCGRASRPASGRPKKPHGRQAAAARPGPGSSLPGNRSRPLWRTSAPAPKSATMRAWPCWRWASRLRSSLAFRPSAVLVQPPCLPPAPCWGTPLPPRGMRSPRCSWPGARRLAALPWARSGSAAGHSQPSPHCSAG